MLGIQGEFWGAYIDLLVRAGFRYPRDHSQCIHHYVLSAVFSFRAHQCYGTVRWEGSQRVSKALIQAKALGIHHHRGILTTIRSSFSEDDTYTSSSSPCHFFGCSETQSFCLIHNSWFITVFCKSVNWLTSLCAPCFFWTGCSTSVWYLFKQSVPVFIVFKAWVFFQQ